MIMCRLRIGVLMIGLVVAATGCVRFSIETPGLAGGAVGDRALMVDVGDVDGDGLAEPLVLTSTEMVTMTVCGPNCLQRESAIALDAADDPTDYTHVTSFAAGDYNGDGIDDVAVGTSESVRVHFGGVQSSTRPTAGLRDDDVSAPIAGRPWIEQFVGPLPGNPWEVVGPADVDDDQADDLVVKVSNEYAYSASTGPTTFATLGTVTFNLSQRLGFYGDALADVDGDGRNELMLHVYGLSSSIFASVVTYGAPGFATFTDGNSSSAFCGIDAAGDLDGDGLDDLLIGHGVHLSTGTSFSSTPTDTAPEGSGLITDLDRDGYGDLLSTDVAANSIGWRHGIDGGRFFAGNGQLELVQRPVDASPGQFVAGDVTGDAFDDVLLIDEGADSARVVLLTNDSIDPDGTFVAPHERPRRSLSNSPPFFCD